MYLDVGLWQRASRSNRPSCCVSTQERGTRTSAGAGRDTCDVAATLRGGELGPKRDFTESTDRGSPATVISEVRVCSPCLRRLHSLDTMSSTFTRLDHMLWLVVLANGRLVDRPWCLRPSNGLYSSSHAVFLFSNHVVLTCRVL